MAQEILPEGFWLATHPPAFPLNLLCIYRFLEFHHVHLVLLYVPIFLPPAVNVHSRSEQWQYRLSSALKLRENAVLVSVSAPGIRMSVHEWKDECGSCHYGALKSTTKSVETEPLMLKNSQSRQRSVRKAAEAKSTKEPGWKASSWFCLIKQSRVRDRVPSVPSGCWWTSNACSRNVQKRRSTPNLCPTQPPKAQGQPLICI